MTGACLSSIKASGECPVAITVVRPQGKVSYACRGGKPRPETFPVKCPLNDRGVIMSRSVVSRLS
ncbi:hypothetical protein IG631_04714 [Alternaria alternata]|nr:hypothetical protein IG631_04714 [Alternaria alternata]